MTGLHFDFSVGRYLLRKPTVKFGRDEHDSQKALASGGVGTDLAWLYDSQQCEKKEIHMPPKS